jgi:hypothetical protein
VVDGDAFPAEALAGRGSVAGVAVRCGSAEWAVRWHTGYPARAVDRHDVPLLCQRFGIPLPEGFEPLKAPRVSLEKVEDAAFGTDAVGEEVEERLQGPLGELGPVVVEVAAGGGHTEYMRMGDDDRAAPPRRTSSGGAGRTC